MYLLGLPYVASEHRALVEFGALHLGEQIRADALGTVGVAANQPFRVPGLV